MEENHIMYGNGIKNKTSEINHVHKWQYQKQ